MGDQKHDDDNQGCTDNAGKLAISVDWERYREYLEAPDLSDEEKQQLIEALWSIMVSFVDLGFRISPVREICGEADPLAAIAEQSIQDVIEYDDADKKLDEDAGELPPACTTGGDDEC